MRELVLVSVLAGCSASPATKAPKHDLPPLETSALAAIAQGPGAEWAIAIAPKAIFGGPLAPSMHKLVPAQGLDNLAVRLGFDLRHANEAWMVGYAATTFYAARLPDGVAPSGALDAFDKRLVPPQGKQSPRPDLVRLWGSLAAGTRASIAGMWSSQGDVVVGEGGRLGPVLASMALATKKLSATRALANDKTFGPLIAWAKGAEIALFARCPLGASIAGAGSKGAKEDNVLANECFGAAITLRPSGAGKLAVAAHVTGAWGNDANAASEQLRATFARVSESDLGRSLGLRDATIEVRAAPEAVDGELVVDANAVATGLRRLLDADISAAVEPVKK